MATHKSAVKRARQSVKRNERNTGIRSHTRNTVRDLREKLGNGEKDAEALAKATRELERAASKGVMHKRTAARQAGRLVKAYNKA